MKSIKQGSFESKSYDNLVEKIILQMVASNSKCFNATDLTSMGFIAHKIAYGVVMARRMLDQKNPLDPESE